MAPDGPSDRMRETLKSPYDEDGDFWTALFNAFSEEFDQYEDALEQVETNTFVDTANAGSLERLATIFDIQRETTESVPEFRARLKTALRSQITSATVNEIQAVTAVILGADRDQINIIEPSDFSPAFIELDLPEVLNDLDAGRVIEIVELVTAAGVEVGIRVITDSASVVAINDDFEVGPFAENELPEGIAVLDGSQVEPFDELYKQDVVSLGDAEQTEPFDGMFKQDSLSLGDGEQTEPFDGLFKQDTVGVDDTQRVRTDESVEAVWNEGKWGINFWHTFEELPDEDISEGVAFSGVGLVVERDSVGRETVAFTDTGTAVERDSTGEEEVAVADTVVFDDPPDTDVVAVTDVAEFDTPPDTESVLPSDEVVLTPHETTDNVWDEGKWGFDVWHTFEELPDEDVSERQVIQEEVTVTPQPTEEYYWNEGIWGFGVWTTD